MQIFAGYRNVSLKFARRSKLHPARAPACGACIILGLFSTRELHLNVFELLSPSSRYEEPCKIVAFQISFNFTSLNVRRGVARSTYRSERVNLTDCFELRCLSNVLGKFFLLAISIRIVRESMSALKKG
ncbi:hypothetical protein PUN28_006815 [Cardiocondyla obscurior]|uniref:Uncharacterized protein n=1 Tax=Cardiocondyla obscurior TaxID=286306 RepID=A0AAW2G1U7_9HYME